jgi:glycosyltransferase involved in cell wall biosynthesis
MALLARVLADGGCEVTVSAIGDHRMDHLARNIRLRCGIAWRGWREGVARGRFDVNLIVQHVPEKYLAVARRNALIPNPEWFLPEYRQHLPAFDRVFAKTREGQRIFDALGCRTELIGFTSPDRRIEGGQRAATFLHVPGRSSHKGTQPIVAAWMDHPDWPLLTVVQREKQRIPAKLPANLRFLTHYLADAELQRLQNGNAFHLCPSETEGFGHYLVEGMSAGAVVLTTDAPPMNEIVTVERGLLVAWTDTGSHHLATTYHVDAQTLGAAVERALALTSAQRTALGERARAWYEENDREFRARLIAAADALANL